MSALINVKIDPADSRRLIFRDPISLQAAILSLWGLSPPPPGSLRNDPNERAVAGRQRRFILDTSKFDVVSGLRHGLAAQYMRKVRPIPAKGKPTLPAWVPAAVKEKIVGNKLASGVREFDGQSPFGKVIVWVSSGRDKAVQLYQEYPGDLSYYLKIAGGDEYKAYLLHKVYTRFNADMRVFVVQRKMSPERARDELRRINEECYKLILLGMGLMMGAGAGISSTGQGIRSQLIRSNATKMVKTVERHGIGRGRVKTSAAPKGPPEAPPPRGTASGSGGRGGAATQAAVQVKDYGGPGSGQQIAVISSRSGRTPEIALERRLEGGIAHRNLAVKAWKRIAAGERRFSVTLFGPRKEAIVNSTYSTMQPLVSDLPDIARALRKVGWLDDAGVTVLKDGVMKAFTWINGKWTAG